MDASAVIMMIVGMLIIWGGLAASIINAVKSSK
ncbi:methionine/alanine import family NSS transporter small subunit [Evansella sp. AB-rgal1]